jgi:hypothetical protein
VARLAGESVERMRAAMGATRTLERSRAAFLAPEGVLADSYAGPGWRRDAGDDVPAEDRDARRAGVVGAGVGPRG